MKRSIKRLLLIAFAAVFSIGIAAAAGLVVFLRSPEFTEDLRLYVVKAIADRTGGQVSLGALKLEPFRRRFELEDLTIRGLEGLGQPPLTHIERIVVGLNVRSLLQKRLDLFELTVVRPEFHVTIDSKGKTNLPGPQRRTESKVNLQVSVSGFTVVDGEATINERRVHIDFSVANLDSDLKYNSTTEVLTSQLGFDGAIRRQDQSAIPYKFSALLDYTRGVVLLQHAEIRSGASLIKLQGRINDALASNIAGKLEYSGVGAVPFMNYFYPAKHFKGAADLTGKLEFSGGYLFTNGRASLKAVDYESWSAKNVHALYSYRFPDRRLTVRELDAEVEGGSAKGDVVVENLPGAAHVVVGLDYRGIDAAPLARVYPWDPKYRIYSRLDGSVTGWFEGAFERYEFDGDAKLTSYSPPRIEGIEGIVALPLDGTTEYGIVPGTATVRNADVRLFSTNIRADGLINAQASSLKVALVESSNLGDLSFIYAGANGAGTFTEGTLTGPIRTPVVSGRFDLRGYKYREWTIQEAEGRLVRYDALTTETELRDVRVTQGMSNLTVNGTATLNSKAVDLRLNSTLLTGEEVSSLSGRKVGGRFSGNAVLKSLEPIRLEGDLQATDLSFEGRSIGTVRRAHLVYQDPNVELTNLSVENHGATLTGNVAYQQDTEHFRFSLRTAALDFDAIRDLGVPPGVKGTIQRAEVSGDGTRNDPNVRGSAEIRDLTFQGEVFPVATIELRSTGQKVHVDMKAAKNLTLAADIDTSVQGYPFEGDATFTAYSLERLAGLSQGTLTATGTAKLRGALEGKTELEGGGEIRSLEGLIQQRAFHSTAPFRFSFDTRNLTVTEVSLSSAGAERLTLGGTIALTPDAQLNLEVDGELDAGLLSTEAPDWASSGSVTVFGRVRGTAKNPDLQGTARINNVAVSHSGFSNSLTKLNGDVFFQENRIHLEDLEGLMGGGKVSFSGDAVLKDWAIDSMHILVDATNVRFRYVEGLQSSTGLRATVGGPLVLGGSLASPLLEGSLQIESMTFGSQFDEFLALFRKRGGVRASSPADSLRLAVHVTGNRNITIKNELAEVGARVDIDIRGTVANPVITGHVEADGGNFVFQGARYRVIRGNIDFVDPVGIAPVLDIQAETEIRNYRVTMMVSGPSDQLRLGMSSDPPLPETEIVNLIAGGKTSGELVSRTGSPTSDQLFQGGAASILIDLLKSRLGSTFGLMGLDRIQLNSFQSGVGTKTSLGVTVPVQVSKDLSVTYSRDLSSNRQDIIEVEYFLSKNISIVATRDDTGSLGMDLKLRQRF